MKILIALLASTLAFGVAGPSRTGTSTVCASRGTVPNVVGMTDDDAKSALNRAGFYNLRLAYEKGGFAPGYPNHRVLGTTPTAGSVVIRCGRVFVELGE